MGSRFLQLTEHWSVAPCLLAVDDIKGVFVARNPQETLIRHKSGGYTVVKHTVDAVRLELNKAGAV